MDRSQELSFSAPAASLRRAVPIDLQTYAGYRDKVVIDLNEQPLIGQFFAGSGLVDVKQLRADRLDVEKKQLFSETLDLLKAKNRLPYSKLTIGQQNMLLQRAGRFSNSLSQGQFSALRAVFT